MIIILIFLCLGDLRRRSLSVGIGERSRLDAGHGDGIGGLSGGFGEYADGNFDLKRWMGCPRRSPFDVGKTGEGAEREYARAGSLNFLRIVTELTSIIRVNAIRASSVLHEFFIIKGSDFMQSSRSLPKCHVIK